MISGALHCAAKELRVALRDPWALVMWLIVPLTVGGMVTAMSGRDGGPQPTAQLLVVDEDQSFISQLMLGAFAQEQAGQLIQVRVVEREQGREQINAGSGSALLIIPAGFSDAVLNERPVNLELLTNPAQTILPGIVEEFLLILTDGVFYLHRVFGEELQTIAGQIDASIDGEGQLFDNAMIARLSVSINEAVETIVDYMDPPALALAATPEDDAQSGPSYALVFFPGIIFMGILFAAQGLSNSFWREREDGTLRRTVVSPLSLTEIFAGKIIAGAAMLLLLTSLLATLGFAYHGIGIARWLPSVLWLTLSGLVMFGLMAVLQIVAPSRKSASLVSNLVVFPLMMLGGAFFPFEAMPDWLRAAGQWVPNGFLLERLKSYLIYDGGLATLASGSLVAIAMALVLWGLCGWRLRSFAGASE